EETDEYRHRAELVGNGKATRIISLVSKQDRNSIQSLCDSLGYAPEEIPLPESVKEKGPGKATTSKPKQKTPRKGQRTPRQSPKKNRAKKKETPYKGLPRPTFDQL